MIVVTFALPAESSAFIRSLKNVKRVGAVVRGELKHRTSNICVLHTGVGAAKCEERPADLVIADNASELSKKARAILPDAVIGKIHSADRIIDPAVDRYEIGRQHGAIAIDMETETIVRLCAEKAIPVLALRVISDSPAAPFPMPPSVLFDIEKQHTNFFALFAYIMHNPVSAIHLAQFSKQITHAKTKLADALCAVLRAM